MKVLSKARSASWWLVHHVIPVVLVRCYLALAVIGKVKDRPLRGWLNSRPEERVWEGSVEADGRGRATLLRLKNAMIYRDYGGVIAEDRRLLIDASPWFAGVGWAGQTALTDLRIPVDRFDGRIVGVLCGRSAYNYYHWLMEILPKIEVISKNASAKNGVAPDAYLIPKGTSFEQETLRFLGISDDYLIGISGSETVQVGTALVATLPGRLTTPSHLAVNFLRSAFRPAMSTVKPWRRLYVTRSDAGGRRVINEDRVLAELQYLGFELVSLTGWTVEQQVRHFSEAEIVVGPHGAGMTNTAFMQNGSKGLLEFMPVTYKVPCFETICALADLPYICIVSSSLGGPEHDMDVDASEVRAAVLSALNNDE